MAITKHQCGNCGHIVNKDDRFCSSCGDKMFQDEDSSCNNCGADIGSLDANYCPNCGEKIHKQAIETRAFAEDSRQQTKKTEIEINVVALLVDAVVQDSPITGYPKLPTRREWLWKKRITVIQESFGLTNKEKQYVLDELETLQGIDDVYWLGTMPWIRFLDKGWLCYMDSKKFKWVMWPADKSSIIKTRCIKIKRTV